MKTRVKILLPFALLCYLVVSSIAVVHALPITTGGVDNTQELSIVADMTDMSPDCHQQQGDASVNSGTACKIFCAAMGNVIANEFILDLPSSTVNAQVAFGTIEFNQLPPSMEPHPPK